MATARKSAVAEATARLKRRLAFLKARRAKGIIFGPRQRKEFRDLVVIARFARSIGMPL